MAQGVIRLRWGSDSTAVPLVSGEDVALVAVGVLTVPSVPSVASYRVIGAVLTLRDVLVAVRRVLGRDVRCEEISNEEWRHDALAQGFNPHAVEHLSQLWRSFRTAGLRSEPATLEVTDTI